MPSEGKHDAVLSLEQHDECPPKHTNTLWYRVLCRSGQAKRKRIHPSVVSYLEPSERLDFPMLSGLSGSLLQHGHYS